MSYAFRPAKRSEAKPLIGLYAESGCGKTFSALLLARGFVGPTGRVGMIETESGRGEVYEDDPRVGGGYLVCPMREDFSPSNYGAALTAAEGAGLGALIIDSASHEWEGSGGVLAMAASAQAAGKKGPLVWQEPKLSHQRYFMLRLMQTPIPLVVVCMRAKYPMVEALVDGKKEWTRSKTLEPKQSEDILYELMAHGWIDREHKFHGTKYTRDDLKAVLVDGQAISIETGQRLAQWAAGASDRAPAGHVAHTSPEPSGNSGGSPDGVPDINEADRRSLLDQINDHSAALGLSVTAQAKNWRDHVGPGVTVESAPIAKLAALADVLSVRRKPVPA